MSDSLESGVSDAPDSIQMAWEALEADWDDPAAHKRFVALCMSLDRLSEAGKRYRKVREADEKRRAEAERQIDRILVQAMSSLEVLRSTPSPKRNTFVLLVALVVFVVLVLGATWAIVAPL